MQIHELNEYTENPSAGDWLIVDTGDDTAKVSGARFAYKTQMDIIEAEIDDVLTNNNGYKIDTLWTGSIYSGGSSAALANPITNYDYLDFYFYAQGVSQIYTADASTGDLFVRSENVPDSTSSRSIAINESKFVIANQAVSLEFNHTWKWSGSASASASITSNDAEVRLTKIVGRKCVVNQSDAEVEDIRIAYDGTVYPTAGDAVRTQIEQAMQSGGGGVVDDHLSTTSTNAVQNRVITNALGGKVDSSDLATVATSGDYDDLTNRPTIPTGIPSGGTAGQFLVKASGTDYDVAWTSLSTWQGGNY